jgi:tRNA-2-methylthio-N6-dimethylallyladenosine synthase
MNYHIVTFGCAANTADSERIASYYQEQGYTHSPEIAGADVIVINTCMIRQKAADRVTGLLHNLKTLKRKNKNLRIILTGCMVGLAVRDTTGKAIQALRKQLPIVDDFLPIEEVGFRYAPVRTDTRHALVPISNGCNNFCTFCIVPFTRGREISRPPEDIISECKELARQGYSEITLIGQNVNSYGADIIKRQKSKVKSQKVTFVKHLGRLRIPTLFPYLLRQVALIDGFTQIQFISSNPWDFSDELIGVIAQYPNISKSIHLPVQSGDTRMLKKMNRWYTRSQYLALVRNLRKHIPGVTISTDFIVGFCGETETQFANTVSLADAVGFSKAYISIYSDRPMTAAHKVYKDDIPYAVKKRRWEILDERINKSNLRKGIYG